jgi:glycerol-3-phosphate dehydrogenase
MAHLNIPQKVDFIIVGGGLAGVSIFFGSLLGN